MRGIWKITDSNVKKRIGRTVVFPYDIKHHQRLMMFYVLDGEGSSHESIGKNVLTSSVRKVEKTKDGKVIHTANSFYEFVKIS